MQRSYSTDHVRDQGSFEIGQARPQSEVFDAADRKQQFWRQFSHISTHEAKSKPQFLLESLSMFSNILAGPGMLVFPLMVQESGWLVALVALVVFSVLTAGTGSLLSKALRQLSREECQYGVDYPRYELADMVQHLFGRTAFFVFQLFLNCGMFLLCLASLVVAGETVNRLIIVTCGNSFELQVTGEGGFGFQGACSASDSISDCVWDQYERTRLGITLGYMAVVALCVPLTQTSFANLMSFQYVATAVTLTSVIIFTVTCFLPSSSPSAGWHLPNAIGDDPALAISTCFLSFAITFLVPSWWNDNMPDCPAKLAVHTSMIYTSLVYYFPIAFLPALAFTFPDGEDALDIFLDSTSVNLVAVVGAYALTILGIMPNVIAYSIAMRDNLQALGPWFTPRKSNLIACAGPIVVGWFLDNTTGFGQGFSTFTNWSALAILGCINYVVPLALVLKLARDDRLAGVPSSNWSEAEVYQTKVMLALVISLIAYAYAQYIITLTPHEIWIHRHRHPHHPKYNGTVSFVALA